jgi:hypothetical protein
MGKETAGGEQNGCGPTASRLVGGALSAIPVSSSRRTRLLRWRQLVISPAPPRDKRGCPACLYVIVHREFVRVGTKTQRVVFFLFHVDPVGDEVFVEDVAAQQEGMIGLERFDRAPE